MIPRRRHAFVYAAIVVLAIALAALIPAQRAAADDPPYFAIKGARIVPVSGPPIEDGTVVIAKGLIAAVGKDVPIPPEAWVIDGKGLTVYPGLIDALSDVGLPSAAPAQPAGGGRGAQPTPPAAQQQQQPPSRGPEDRPQTTPWLVGADELKPDDKRIEQWRNAGFTTALVAPTRGFFPGQGAVMNLAGERASEMVVKAPATLNVSLQGGGGFGGGFPNSLMGILAYVHQVFIDAAWYDEASAAYEKNPKGAARIPYDRTARVVGHAVRDREPVFVSANSANQIYRALRMAPQWNPRFVLYGVQEGYAVADAIAATKLPVLVNLRWPERSRDADPEQEDSLRVLRFRDRAPSTPAALAKASVPFAFYAEGIANPKDIVKNAAKAIAAGLSADAALRAFTLSAAEILGVADRLGSIEPGKIANLVITDGDIFNEKTKVKIVFVDGRRFEVREEERPPQRGPQAPPMGEVQP